MPGEGDEVWWSRGGGRFHSTDSCEAFIAGQEKARAEGRKTHPIEPGSRKSALSLGLQPCMSCCGSRAVAKTTATPSRTIPSPGQAAKWRTWVGQHDSVFATPYEREFVRSVLPRVVGLAPTSVHPQRSVTANGQGYSVDFAIEEPDVRIAIEIDGFNKSGAGPPTSEEHNRTTERHSAIEVAGWHVIRFTNHRVRRDPDGCAKQLSTLLQDRRRAAAGHAEERRRADALVSATRRVQAASQPHSPPPAGRSRSGVWLALLVAVVLLGVVMLAVSGGTTNNRSRSPADPSDLGGHPPVGNSCPQSAPLKGNVSQSGELIYHSPGGEFYSRTVPEACFVNEGEARNAGFRPSAR